MDKNTKIVATLGPASSKKEILTKLTHHGANVFRLNFSHGTHEEHLEKIKIIREIEKETGNKIGILADLQGPKIRLGNIDEMLLKKNDEITLSLDGEVPLDFDIFVNLKKDQRIFINDGVVELKVLEVNGKSAKCKILAGGKISSHKGLNLPDTIIPNASITQKDKKDIEFILKQDVDFVALSFVQNKEDIFLLRKLLGNKDYPKIVAKIETQQAINNIEEIVKESDIVMVARGDLGVEVGQEEVPILQRKIIRICRRESKPVIVATQMLESMITNAVPTRAEVNDVATAILDETDAVMLSGETASGAYPIEAVSMMAKIARRVERHKYEVEVENSEKIFNTTNTDANIALSQAANLIAKRVGAQGIFDVSESGFEALHISSNRPKCPIFVERKNEKTAGEMTIVYGVYSFDQKEINKFKDENKPVIEVSESEIRVVA